MKIDNLLKREDFYSILEHTLNHYYRDILHNNVKVRVENGKLANSVVIYPKLNRIIRRKPDRKIVTGIYRSFNINDNCIKKFFAQLYITLLVNSRGIMSSRSIFYSDLSVFTPLHEICGGNKKVRINDYNHMQSDVVIKDGFRDDYFRSEMSFRLTHKAPYLVPILEYGEDWYREQLIDGTSLARVTDKVLYQNLLQKALGYLGELVEQTRAYVSGEDYSKLLEKEIRENLEKVFTVKNDVNFERHTVEGLVQQLLERVSKIERIPIAISHGDFQTGNILVDKQEKVYIIDWETYKTRSVWYDAIAALLFIRRVGRWKNILKNQTEKNIADAIYHYDKERVCSVEQAIAVLLLEDLSFRLTDTLMVPGVLGSSSINSFIREVTDEGEV